MPSMKRMIVRFTLLSMVVGLGTVVVYEAQRRLHPPESATDLADDPQMNLEATPIPMFDGRQAVPLVSQAPPDSGTILATNQEQGSGDYQPFHNDVADEPATELQPDTTGDPYTESNRLAAQSQEYFSPPGPLPLDSQSDQLLQQTAADQPLGEAEPEMADPLAGGTAGAETGADEGWRDAFAPPSAAARGNYRAPANAATLTPPASTAPTARGVGRPGERQLEGAQAPSLTIEKRAPTEIQVGKAATFTTTVRNQGQVTAQGVEVRDLVPQGTELVGTIPQAEQGPQGELVWQLGNLKPGTETTVQMQLMPLAEGEIGSVATLHFQAGASVRTVATRPAVAIEVTAPARVMVGGEVMLRIKISNPGTGAATGVVLTETVPPQLQHTEGGELELEIGTLKPGESRLLELPLKAARAGSVDNLVSARAEGNVRAEGHVQLEVVAPDLKISMSGPKRRYLERAAVYNITVSNPGTAAAQDIEVAAVLPKGLKFVEANNAGQYDQATGAVYWSLEQLPAGETGVVTLSTLPIEPGELHLQINARGQGNLTAQADEAIFVEGIAAILFEVVDVNDPIEVGGETTYEIRVVNQGSKAATNVRLVALLPAELQALGADGPTAHAIDGQRVLFEPISQLAPKADTTFTVKVKASSVGDVRLRVQVVTDEMRSPVTKEESTHVYADE
jgi:uncharacterized repeat protein (TIGR01451 family)